MLDLCNYNAILLYTYRKGGVFFIKHTTISVSKTIYLALKQYCSQELGRTAKKETEKAILNHIKKAKKAKGET